MNPPETPANGTNYHPYRVGDWNVEPAAGQISRGRTGVKLEPKVMEVLSYLASRQGELVTRDDLERDVWKGAIVGYDSITTAIIKLRKAISIAPNYADGYGLIALISNNLGEPERALEFATKGMRLNPYYTWDYPYNLGRAYYTLGNYDNAIKSLTSALERNENAVPVRLFLAASYVHADRLDDAEWEIEQIMVLTPSATITHTRNTTPIQKSDLMESFLADLRKAGMPE